MDRINISEAQMNTSPNPFSLVCASTPSGTTNLTAVSWWTYLANRPPMLGFSIGKKSYTNELISQNRKAILSVPGKGIADEAFRCGCVSGRNIDKATEYGIILVDVDESSIRIPIHTKIAFLCTLDKAIEVGDHSFFICSIDEIYYDAHEQQLYTWDGYRRLASI